MSKFKYIYIITRKFLIKEYIKNKKSTRNIAKKIKCTKGTILRYLRRYKIKIRNQSEAMLGKVGYWRNKKRPNHSKKFSGENHSLYKGWKKDRGYILIYVPNHPHKINGTYVYEHRLVMEARLNKISLKKWVEYGRTGNYPKKVRFLTSKEIIHHLNGIRDDNRFKNLYLSNRKSHEHNTFVKLLQKRIKYLESKLKQKDK